MFKWRSLRGGWVIRMRISEWCRKLVPKMRWSMSEGSMSDFWVMMMVWWEWHKVKSMCCVLWRILHYNTACTMAHSCMYCLYIGNHPTIWLFIWWFVGKCHENSCHVNFQEHSQKIIHREVHGKYAVFGFYRIMGLLDKRTRQLAVKSRAGQLVD